MTYAYKCYSQNRTGTVSARQKKGLSIEGIYPVPMVQDWKLSTMVRKVFHTIFGDREETARAAEAILMKGATQVEQTDTIKDKASVEERLQQERSRYDILLEMRMNNEIQKEIFYRKQMEVEGKIAELERLLIQYQDVKAATDEDVVDKLKNLKSCSSRDLCLRTGNLPRMTSTGMCTG